MEKALKALEKSITSGRLKDRYKMERRQGGQDESWKRVVEGPSASWAQALAERRVSVLDGGLFGSGQYVAKLLQENPRSWAIFKEGKEAFEKASPQGSTLKSAFLKLFDTTGHYTGSFKNKEHGGDDFHLSLVMLFTLDGFVDSFSGRGSGDSGYLSRNVLAWSENMTHFGEWRERDLTKEQTLIDRIQKRIPPPRSDLDGLFSGLVPSIGPGVSANS